MNKDNLYEFLGTAFVTIIITLIFVLYADYNKPTYEYAIEGKIYKSKDCYQSKDGNCYCMKDNKYIVVDNYYIAK